VTRSRSFVVLFVAAVCKNNIQTTGYQKKKARRENPSRPFFYTKFQDNDYFTEHDTFLLPPPTRKSLRQRTQSYHAAVCYLDLLAAMEEHHTNQHERPNPGLQLTEQKLDAIHKFLCKIVHR
jgi:hypothetical protein